MTLLTLLEFGYPIGAFITFAICVAKIDRSRRDYARIVVVCAFWPILAVLFLFGALIQSIKMIWHWLFGRQRSHGL